MPLDPKRTPCPDQPPQTDMDTKDILAELIRIEAKIAKQMPERRDDLTTVSIVFTGMDHENIRALIAKATTPNT